MSKQEVPLLKKKHMMMETKWKGRMEKDGTLGFMGN